MLASSGQLVPSSVVLERSHAKGRHPRSRGGVAASVHRRGRRVCVGSLPCCMVHPHLSKYYRVRRATAVAEGSTFCSRNGRGRRVRADQGSVSKQYDVAPGPIIDGNARGREERQVGGQKSTRYRNNAKYSSVSGVLHESEDAYMEHQK